MANDFRLKYRGSAVWENPEWGGVGAAFQDWGNLVRYSVHGPPTMTFGDGGNRAVYTFMVGLEEIDDNGPPMVQHVIANILGWSEVNSPNLNRRMPLSDPDGMGMVAEKILHVEYSGTSGFNPRSQDPDAPTPIPEFVTGFIKIPDGRTVNWNFKAIPLYNYAIIVVEFCHPLYPIRKNDNLDSFETNDERGRYMLTVEQPSSEYVQVPRGQIQWREGPNVNEINADGGNLVRMVQSITLTWHRLPVDAVFLLVNNNWKKLLGTVNQTELILPLYNDAMTYPAETMLFSPYRTKPRLSPHGFLEFDVELHWAFRGPIADEANSPTWNKFLHPNGNYYRVGWGPGPVFKDLYTQADHDLIFQIA